MSHEHIQPHALGVPDAARYIGVGRTRIYELIGSGELKSLRIGGRRLIRRADLEEFISRHLGEA